VSLGVLLLPAAQGAEWFPLPIGKDVDQYYYDRSKLVISGEEITYWKKVIFRNPQKFKDGRAKSAIYRERIHCKEHTHRTLNYTLYSENGSVLETLATPEAAAEPVQPETVGDQFEKNMCELLAAKRKSQDSATPEVPKTDPKKQALQDELEKLRLEKDRIDLQIRKLEHEISGSVMPPAGDSKPPQPGEI
jgi:hypothetical protein